MYNTYKYELYKKLHNNIKFCILGVLEGQMRFFVYKSARDEMTSIPSVLMVRESEGFLRIRYDCIPSSLGGK